MPTPTMTVCLTAFTRWTLPGASNRLTWPGTIAGLVGISAAAAWLERRLERDPVYPVGLWLGGGVAYLTVALNVLVLALGGREGVRGVAGFVFLANLPVIVVEAVAMGFVLSYLHVAKPEWLNRRR